MGFCGSQVQLLPELEAFIKNIIGFCAIAHEHMSEPKERTMKEPPVLDFSLHCLKQTDREGSTGSFCLEYMGSLWTPWTRVHLIDTS